MGIWEKYPRVEFCAYGTREDEKVGGDAEATAREGGDEAAGEEERGAATAFT